MRKFCITRSIRRLAQWSVMKNVLTMVFVGWLSINCLVGAPFAQKVTVVTEEMAPYNFIDEKGQVVGLATELVQEIFKRANIEHQINVFPWSRAYRMAQGSPNTAIYSMGRNEERENLFKWVGVVATREVFVYKLKSRPDIKAKRLEDLKQYKLGGIRDGVRTMHLRTEGFAVEESTDDSSNIKKLQAHRIDGFPIDEANLAYLAPKNGFDFNAMERLIKLEKMSGDLYLAFSLHTADDIVEKCRFALDSMVKDGTFNRITSCWLTKK